MRPHLVEKVNGLHLYATPSSEEVAMRMGVDPVTGLDDTTARARLLQYGPNLPVTRRKVRDWIEFLRLFKSPILLILLAAALVSFLVGETVSGGIIVGTILLSVTIDFFLERDARRAAETLRRSVQARATVLRNGKEVDLPPDSICPGDILVIRAGQVVAADARLLDSQELFVNQSMLTGESFPAEKTCIPVDASEGDISSFDNILFMGSGVQSGSGRAVVVRTGASTEFGKVAAQLEQPADASDFARGMGRFGVLVMRITLMLVIGIFAVNTLLHHGILESLLFSLAVAVGLTPELLPMIMSVTMSRGSMRMAKKGVVVKKVMAIPNFGSMDVLCTDKTGTLTQDHIDMVDAVDVRGVSSPEVFRLAWMNAALQEGHGNPLDEAIVRHGEPGGPMMTRIGEVPFDFVRRRMSLVVDDGGKRLILCKGAPEEVFKACSPAQGDIDVAMALFDAMSRSGFRLLALASKEVEVKDAYGTADEEGLTLRGFVSFLDPPKEDAREVIGELREIGVEVKVITGDNRLVTEKVCSAIQLPVKGVLEGRDIEAMSDDALAKAATDVTIFARFSPEQKSRVIRVLRSVHHAVGYLGDGINDGPSLRGADVGISVSSATDVARDAADIILTRKDLSVLKDGILEGRKTFANTMKYIHMDLSSNFGNMFSVAVATIFLPYLPMLPVQILLNNFLYDTSQVAIPTDQVDEAHVRQPRRWNMRMIRTYMIIFGLTSSAFDMATFYLLFKAFPVTMAQFRTGWFMESLATQILVVFIIRTSASPFWKREIEKTEMISRIWRRRSLKA